MEDSAEIQKSRFPSSGCYLVGWVEQLHVRYSLAWCSGKRGETAYLNGSGDGASQGLTRMEVEELLEEN